MLPILIMPDLVPEPEETTLEENDVEIELSAMQEFWELLPKAGKRGRVRLGPWVELRHPVPSVTQATNAAPASLQDCDQFLKLLLRRKADSLGRHERADLRRVLHTTGLAAPPPIATLSPETATWLLWAMSSRGVSTVRQLASPPLHPPTLVVQWWTSMPATLCFGPAGALLRVLADCVARLYRFWERMVMRIRVSGGGMLDPRMVRIKFMPLVPGTNGGARD